MLSAGVVFCATTYQALRHLTQVERDWRAFEAVNEPWIAVTNATIRALGYGGFIHSFKNAVIRGDAASIAQTRLQAGKALGALSELDTYASTPERREAVDMLRMTVADYLDKIDVIARLSDRGEPPEVIDDAVRVDDGPARDALETLLSSNTEAAPPRSQLLAELRHALGYTGVIHQFKNLVLRNDDFSRDGFLDALGQARGALEDYRALSLSAEETGALAAIEEALDAYASHLDQAFGPRRAGVWVRNLDAEVRVDDGPALAALEALDRAAALDIAQKSARLSETLDLLEFSGGVGIVVGLLSALLISGGAFVLIQYAIVRPASRVAQEIEKLSKGDVRIDVEKFRSDTEIGTIAAAANAFRDALIELRESRRDLEMSRQMAQHEALHDCLTKLANRRYLDRRLSALSERDDGDVVRALHIDLDNFKQINDSYGHAAGDAILCHVAEALRRITRDDDFIARVGGDEFIVICAPQTSPEGAESMAERIVAELSEPVAVDDHLCRFGASVGIAAAPPGQAKDLLVRADIALYYSKRSGRGRVTEFRPEMQSAVVESKCLTDDLFRALENDEIVAFFQPQFDLRAQELVGVEALARWRHPSLGLLTPGHFLDVAKGADLLAALDRAVFKDVARACRQATERGLALRRVAINVSAERLMSEELLADLAQLHGLPQKFSLEILETMVLNMSDHNLVRRLREIRELGVELDIDDFGSERASIVNLIAMHPNRLKIDKALIDPVAESPVHADLVKAIVQIGRMLSIETVAEGVETGAQIDALRGIGCDILQGYLLGAPMPREALFAFIEAKAWRAAIGATPGAPKASRPAPPGNHSRWSASAR